MKQIALLLISVLCYLSAAAQADSLEQKLKEYKKLFEKGLISQEEYDKVKANTLKINPQPAVQPAVKNEVNASGFSFVVEAGAGLFTGKYKMKMPMEYQPGINTIEFDGWGVPLMGISVVPGYYRCNNFIGAGVSYHHQIKDNKNGGTYGSFDFFLMYRRHFGSKKILPFFDLSLGYSSLRYDGFFNSNTHGSLKRNGLLVEPGLGVSFSKNSKVSLKLCWRFLYLRHKDEIIFTDNVGNVIGSGYAWDTLNYLAVKLGFQLR